MKNVMPFNENWLYCPNFKSQYLTKDIDKSCFENITLPHTNKIVSWHSFDDKQYQFISTYQKQFVLPAKYRKQRIFIDFEGVMAACTVYVNEKRLGEYKGGYTPFSFEITKHVQFSRENIIALKVDSRERKDIPPFGDRIDYLTFGGVYREVNLRIVNHTYIKNLFVRCNNPLDQKKKLLVSYEIDLDKKQTPINQYQLKVGVYDKKTLLTCDVFELDSQRDDLSIDLPQKTELWSPETPKLYTIKAELVQAKKAVDQYETVTGFRKAEFTAKGFFLNGKKIKLRGLNRHQTYPFIGAAAPARLQKKDALIIKNELKCNIVRTSHYPQSRHFLDCCDQIGLLVFEEIPGWQHIGDKKWKQVLCEHTEAMVKRDCNRPSIILWGTRVNESKDDDLLYEKTNAIAHHLDDSRQTGGVRNNFKSRLLEDVFTINDFGHTLRKPNHDNYLITEYGGHMFPTKPYDGSERRTEHVLFHASIMNQTYGNDQISGCIGWCAFDYNTHLDFGCGDRVCYHGVYDIFRIPKAAAYMYQSQCCPEEQVVLEPVFSFSINDFQDIGILNGVICSNCDKLKIYAGGNFLAELFPNTKQFPNLPHPPFCTDKITGMWGEKWNELQIDGYLKNKKVITRKMSNSSLDEKFIVQADDKTISADGADMTRCSFIITDKYNNRRYYATAAIQIEIEGPGILIGENPFALVAGAGAIWVKSTKEAGAICVTVRHPRFKEKVLRIKSV